MDNNAEVLDVSYSPDDVRRVAEQLAVAQAVLKVAGEATNTRSGYLRTLADDMLLKMHDDYGAEKIELKIGGEKVGTLSLTVKEGVVIEDYEAVQDWEIENGFAHETPAIDLNILRPDTVEKILQLARMDNPISVSSEVHYKNIEDIAEHVGENMVTSGGEVVPGVKWRREVKGTRISGCTPRDVSRALSIGGADYTIAGLLSAGVQNA